MSIGSVDRKNQTNPSAPVTQATVAKTNTAAALDQGGSTFASGQAARAPQSNTAVPTRTGMDLAATKAGPVDVDSAEGKAAIDAAINVIASQQGVAAGSIKGDLKAFTVEKDSLGMTHVRLNREHNGVPVLGEQVIVHIRKDGSTDVTGSLSDIPADLGKGAGSCDEKKAIAAAKAQFQGPSDGEPSVRKVIVAGADGTFNVAYQVEITNFQNVSAENPPARMNYLVDAKTGEVSESWNQMGGIDQKDIDRANESGAAKSAAGAGESIETRKTAEPKAAITDLATTTSEIEVAEGMTLENVTLDLNIKHTWKGDLKITLVSPSGKEVVVHDRKGGSTDDVNLSAFDVSESFAGEKAAGKWTLKVEDKAKRDTGSLESWSLNLKGKADGPPPPKGDDTSIYSGTVDLGTTQNADGTSSLNDTTKGKGVVTKDANNASSGAGAVAINDNNNIWGEATDPERNKAAVDAHYGASMTYDFYKNILGRDSIDGKGEVLQSNVHIRKNYVNAYWDGKTMNYGDGDNKTASNLTTLDIAGHEITHGLTERTAGLIYRNESGGLNEAMSDIMGTGVEWYASQQNPAVKFDWAVGEDCWTPNNGDPTDALRYMDDPTKDKYSVDNYKNYPKQTEVHGSSGIANNAFYLLSEGGTNRTSQIKVEGGIGIEDSLKIFGRALTTYMTPSTTFAQGREACIKAATDLFGADSTQVAKVKEAWTAVGVG